MLSPQFTTIRIAKGAEIVDADGHTHVNARPRYVKAQLDTDSGCYLFTLPVWGRCYVCEDFEVQA